MGRSYANENPTGCSKLVDTSYSPNRVESNEISIEERARRRKLEYADVLSKCPREDMEIVLYQMSDEGFKNYIDRKVLENTSLSTRKIAFGIIFGIIGLRVIDFVFGLIISVMALIGIQLDSVQQSSYDNDGPYYEQYYNPDDGGGSILNDLG